MSFATYYSSGTWRESITHKRFKEFLSPRTPAELEILAQQARQLTWQNFGKTMRLFAPLYLSNECVNACEYCGFSRENESIVRVTLTPEQVETEARYLVKEGFRNLLLVAGEHPKFVSPTYLRECLERLHSFVPSLSLEIGPMETEDYLPLVKAGADGLVVYQETYDSDIYAELHTAGPKKDFNWRLDCVERAYQAGFKRLGIGALFGLADWRIEALSLAAHIEYLLKYCWKSFLTVSLPRLRPAAGEFAPLTSLDDRDLAQLICALRLTFPQIGLVLSTREPQRLRDGLIPMGVTHMSAGSHTEPGGYTGAGQEEAHHTVKGKAVPLITSEGEHKTATEQFSIADSRSPKEVAQRLQEMGYDPVWKDWDQSLT